MPSSSVETSQLRIQTANKVFYERVVPSVMTRNIIDLDLVRFQSMMYSVPDKVSPAAQATWLKLGPFVEVLFNPTIDDERVAAYAEWETKLNGLHC